MLPLNDAYGPARSSIKKGVWGTGTRKGSPGKHWRAFSLYSQETSWLVDLREAPSFTTGLALHEKYQSPCGLFTRPVVMVRLRDADKVPVRSRYLIFAEPPNDMETLSLMRRLSPGASCGSGSSCARLSGNW